MKPLGKSSGKKYCLSLLLVLAVFVFARANTINVPLDYTTIQSAIDTASSGDTILVDDGIYSEHLNFLGKSITLMSESGPGVTIIQKSIDSLSIVNFVTGEDESSVLKGFTIRNSYNRAAITCIATSPVIENCIIENNTNHIGDLEFTGGGIAFKDNAAPIIRNNIIRNNYGVYGGGISSLDCDPDHRATIEFNYLHNNSVYRTGSALHAYNSSLIFTHNLVYENHAASGYYAAIRIDCRGSLIENNTICNNTAGVHSGGIAIISGSGIQIHIRNNIIYDNSHYGIWAYEGVNAYISYNCFYANPSGPCANIVPDEGNIFEDPLFVNPNINNYYLRCNSPCIDAGDPSSAYDPDSTLADIGALFFDMAPGYGNITGTVTDSTGSPLENAVINIIGTTQYDTTDGLGEYFIGNLPSPGTYDLSCAHPDYHETIIENVCVANNENTEVDITVVATAALLGVVTNFHLNPVAGAIVEVANTELADTTDGSGNYSIVGLPGGYYDISFKHDHYCDTVVSDIYVLAGDTTALDLTFGNYGWLTGIVTDISQNPIEGVVVRAVDDLYADTTDSNGEYLLVFYCPGEFDIKFTHDEYLIYLEEGFVIPEGDTANLDISLCPTGDSDINIWYGGNFENYLWSDTVQATPAETFGTDVWFYGREDVYIGSILTVLGASAAYFDGFDQDGGSIYYPFTEWDESNFINPYDSAGYYNYSFIGFAETFAPYNSPWLHFEIPTRILTYAIEAKDDVDLAGQTFCDALIAGRDPISGIHYAIDSLAALSYSITGWYACVRFGDYPGRGTIAGTVSDMTGVPIQDVYISVTDGDNSGSDYTGPDGVYSVSNLPVGPYSVSFSHIGYFDTTAADYDIVEGFNTLDMTLWSPAGDEVVIWYGNLSGSPVELEIGDIGGIDIYIQTAESICGGNIHVPLGVDDQYFSALLSQSNGAYYYPLTEWDNVSFDVSYGSPPNPAGWSSQSLIGWANLGEPYDSPWLIKPIPSKIARFAVEIADDTSFVGDTVACIAIGEHPTVGPIGVGDTLSGIYFSITVNICEVTFLPLSIKYHYVPGDVNMYNGIWPPQVIGGDITFLVNYFRGFPGASPCLLDGFFASADANGDCQVIGGDVTKLVSYFRGITEMDYCPDYEPEWISPDDAPEDPPSGWPDCGPLVSTVRGRAISEPAADDKID